MRRLDYIVDSSTPPIDKTVLWLKDGILRYNYDNEWIPIVNNGFPKIRKVSPFIHKVDYDRLNYKLALEYLDGIDISTHSFGCSSFRKNGFLCRNYDWYYDNSPTFVVTTPAYDNRYATLGVANGVLNQNFNTPISVINRAIDLMPFYILDGINEKGLFCSLNVVPLDKGKSCHTFPLIEQRDRICNIILGRYIIDNFATADEAIAYLRNYVTIYPSKTLQNKGYEIHYLIGDKTKTYVMEIINNEIVVKEHNIMTNFHIDGVTFNSNGKVYTSANVPEHYPTVDNGITPFGAGLERYNTIVDNIDSITSKEAAREVLKSIYFTRAYRAESLGINEWYSDFVGTYSDRTITVDSTPEEIAPIIEKAKCLYYHRSRDIKNTWQTVHSSIYDLESKTLYITSQEENIEYKFNLEGVYISKGGEGGTSNYEELNNKPKINGIELAGNKSADALGFHQVAMSGDYNSLFNLPVIPPIDDIAYKDWVLEQGFLTQHQSLNEYATETWVENKGYLTQHQDISGKQDVLISGTNIKTINNTSILGEGDITISGGGNVTILTQAEYDTLTEKSETVLYVIKSS